MPPKLAVIYVRVSTTDQADKGVSLDNQERACYDWAFRNGIQILKLFREEGKSAKTLNRPEMKAMIDYLGEHDTEIDYLVVYQIDRLARNFIDFADLMKLMSSYKIALRDSMSNVEAGESDELIQGIQALLAQHDNKLKSVRVTENMKRHANEGYRMHQAPYGLKNTRNELNRPTVEPVEPIATHISYLLESFAKGIFSKGQLLHEARRIGLSQRNGKPISYQYLDKILRQPLYAGLEKSSLTNDQLIPSIFGGIVPEWIYYANQSLMQGRRDNKTDGYRSISPDYPLRKFAICEDCKQPIRGSASTGRGGKKYPRYHCTSRECHSAYVKPTEMQNDWLHHLSNVRPDDGRLNALQVIIVRVWRDEIGSMRRRATKLREQIDSMKEQRLDAIEKVATGDLNKDEKNELIKRLKERIGTIKAELARLDRQVGVKEIAVEYAINYIGNASKLWDGASPELKQTFQRMIYPEGIPYNFRTRQFGTAKMSALYALATIKKDPSESEESLLVIPRGIEPLLPG